MKYKVITELAYTYIGLVTTMTKHYVDDGIPLIFNSSIKVNGIDTSKPVFLDYEFAEKNKNRMHKKDDVVTVHTGDIGVSAVISDDLDGSLGFATIVTRINDFNILLPEYLCAFLNYGGGKEQLYKYSRDARNNLNLTDYNKLIVPVPSIERQREIVDQVNRLKGIIANRIQELQLLDELIKARFVELFGDAVDNPMGWEKKQLQEIVTDDCTISYGIVQTGDDQEDGVPVFRPVDIVNRVPKLEELKKTTEEISNKYKRTILKGREMLITVRANIADTCIVGEDFAGCNVGRGIVPIRTQEDIIILEFLKYLMDSKHLNDDIKSKAKGITLIQLNMEDLREVELIIPPLEQQKTFVEFAKQVDKSKVANLPTYIHTITTKKDLPTSINCDKVLLA